MEGHKPLVLRPIKNQDITITGQYAFLACLSSFMVRYSGVPGRILISVFLGKEKMELLEKTFKP
ncbi:hypothetical protein Pint_15825 [Pistacia integerrima]|uniref:Uncharacterized protein n=1 Tax=Pistacia integerrima TaxID=434235 RepID=A0ACC0Z8L6_9ROSI|nr:hypothetical protein Pint_15825 [Pistacia integerrima]